MSLKRRADSQVTRETVDTVEHDDNEEYEDIDEDEETENKVDVSQRKCVSSILLTQALPCLW